MALISQRTITGGGFLAFDLFFGFFLGALQLPRDFSFSHSLGEPLASIYGTEFLHNGHNCLFDVLNFGDILAEGPSRPAQ